MKRSFKARLFLHVVLITVVVIWANRVIAQYFLTDQLQTRIHQEMGVALTTCADHFENHGAFVNCFKAIEKGSLFNIETIITRAMGKPREQQEITGTQTIRVIYGDNDKATEAT